MRTCTRIHITWKPEHKKNHMDSDNTEPVSCLQQVGTLGTNAHTQTNKQTNEHADTQTQTHVSAESNRARIHTYERHVCIGHHYLERKNVVLTSSINLLYANKPTKQIQWNYSTSYSHSYTVHTLFIVHVWVYVHLILVKVLITREPNMIWR